MGSQNVGDTLLTFGHGRTSSSLSAELREESLEAGDCRCTHVSHGLSLGQMGVKHLPNPVGIPPPLVVVDRCWMSK